MLLMYDSRAAASNDEEMGGCVLEDWREEMYVKQKSPKDEEMGECVLEYGRE